MRNNSLYILVFCFIYFPVKAQENQDAVQLFTRMLESVKKVHTCTYVLNIEERVFDKIEKSQFVTKVNTHPYKVYAYSVFPNPGAEALYIENQNNEKVLVNPNRFPFINLNLPVNSMLLRKRHQYSMREMGFSYFCNIMEGNIRKHGTRFYETLSQKRDTTFNNHDYYVLEINNKDFGTTTYRVNENENVSDIGLKLLVNDHMILELNRNISDYNDVKPGQIIRVPNSFGRKIILFVDKVTWLPLVQVIYDDKGFYSRVDISSFRMNPALNSEEFTSYFAKYNF